MRVSIPGNRRLLSALILAVTAALPATALGQTSLVNNPTTLVFTASADHNALLADGRPAVDHYTFDVYVVGGAQPFQSTNIGKPVPAPDGLVSYDFSGSVASWPLPGGNYESRVNAVGPTGSGVSDASNPFTFSSCTYALSGTSASMPAAGGGTQFTVSTGSACSWTAVSSAAWIALSASGGTGIGTVVATVGSNTSTAARAGAVTVAGQAFTISQAGAAAPGAPASPSPANGATSVGVTPTLAWTSSNASSYTVRFGTSNPPPQVASGLTTTSYAPGTIAGGTTYYWQVVASNVSASTAGSVWSFTTAAPPAPPPPAGLPSPWTSQDIGSVGQPGTASYSAGQFTVAGGGADIWGTSDAFQFVRQPASNNAQIVARVTGEQNTNALAKAGVMLRGGLSAGAAHVTLDVRPDGTVEFMARSAAGGTTSMLAGTTQAAPAWLRLVRSNKTVTASVSADGTTWRTIGSTKVSLGPGASIGLAVTSHDTSLRNTATFDNVSVR